MRSRCRPRLVRCGADHGGDLGFDERVVDGLSSQADAVIDLRGLEGVQDLQRCGLVKGTVRGAFRRAPLAWSR
jgi:hypothetical protein